MGQQHIVVWDPKGEYWEGALVDDAKAHLLGNRGVCVMPVDPLLFKLSGVGGYMRRAWGSGWPMDQATPRHIAPLTVFIPTPDPGRPPRRLHWRARLMPQNRADVGPMDGYVRFTADTPQMLPHRISLSRTATDETHVGLRALKAPDEHGGWTIGGSAGFAIREAACYPLGLYGMQAGVRIVWAAVSLS